MASSIFCFLNYYDIRRQKHNLLVVDLLKLNSNLSKRILSFLIFLKVEQM